MSKHLYEEALVEVRQLRQLAEDNARRAVMEELEPKIKQLIEKQLLEVDNVTEEDEPAATSPTSPTSKETPGPEGGDEERDDDDLEENVLPLGEGSAALLVKMIGGSKSSDPARYHDVVRFVKSTVDEAAGRELVTLEEVVKGAYVVALNTLPAGASRSRVEDRLDECYKMVQEAASRSVADKRRLKEASLNIKISGFKEEAVDEDTLSGLSIVIVPESEAPDSGEGEEAAEPAAEKPEEAEAVPGDDEELDLGDLGAGEPAGEEEKPEQPVKKEGKNMNQFAMLSDDTVVEIDEGMLRREIARMKALREAKEGGMPKHNPKGHGAASAVHHFGGGKSVGEPFEDGESLFDDDDLMESWMKDEADGPATPMNPAKKDDDDDDLDEVVAELMANEDEDLDEMGPHVDEEVDETAGPMDEDDDLDEAKPSHGEDPSMPTHSAQGVNPGTSTMTQQNESRRRLAALVEARKSAARRAAAAKRKAAMAKKKGDKKSFTEARRVFVESVKVYHRANAAITALTESTRRSNSGAREVQDLRNQLAETNLFNAKLLYTNKLLQNEALSPRQKVAIIEKLDEARSLREAKLVYESLTRTIASGKASVNEGANRQVLGSASRATRPSSTVSLNEGVETARWARLAGITK